VLVVVLVVVPVLEAEPPVAVAEVELAPPVCVELRGEVPCPEFAAERSAPEHPAPAKEASRQGMTTLKFSDFRWVCRIG